MLTGDGCTQRQRNLWAVLPDRVDWVLIGDNRHVQYFCGFRANPVGFSADQSAALLLFRDGSAVLLADNFTRRTAVADVFVSDEVIQPWYDHRHSVGNRSHALAEALASQVSRLDRNSGLAECEGISAQLMSLVPDVAVSVTIDGQNHSLGTVIHELRRCKLPDEIGLMQQCMDAGAAGQAAAFDAVRVGASELDVYGAVQSAAQQAAGCVCVVYGDFRATNATVFKAGGLPTNYRLQNGDLCLLDFSVVIGGYRSDFTNTIAVETASSSQLAQADACIAALEAAESMLACGVNCSDVFDTASGVLAKYGVPGLSHHAGHGLGLEHPEAPILVAQSTETLRAGDVVTLEPGLYVDGVGGMRFEHNYLITESGANRLSHHRLGLYPA